MSSVVTVKLKYNDNSRSMTESYNCADSHPSAAIIKNCEQQTIDKWIALGGTQRSMEVHTVIK